MTGAETPVRTTTMVTMCRTKHMDQATMRALEAMVLAVAQAMAVPKHMLEGEPKPPCG